MKKQKSSKEKKPDELKRLKIIVKELNVKNASLEKDLVEVNKLRRQSEHKAEEMEKELKNAKEELEKAKQNLTDIQKAIETAAAMRYPEAGITYTPAVCCSHESEQRNSKENDEVRLLRHLYELSTKLTELKESYMHRFY